MQKNSVNFDKSVTQTREYIHFDKNAIQTRKSVNFGKTCYIDKEAA